MTGDALSGDVAPNEANGLLPKPVPINVTIKSGTADVIGSGLVTAFSDNPIEITLGPKFKLIFVFEEEAGAPISRMNAEMPDANSIQITCYNFKKEPFVAGHGGPLSVGSANGRRLYLQFRVLPLALGDMTLIYTFYAGEAVNGE